MTATCSFCPPTCRRLPTPRRRQSILPQYDNPLAHAWFAGLLDSLGFPASDLQTPVTARALREDGHIWRIQADAVFLNDVALDALRGVLRLPGG